MKSKIAQASLSPVAAAVAAAVFLACSAAYAGSGSWIVDASGVWSTGSNWSPATPPGTAAGDIVSLTTNITAARTITLDTSSRTNGTLIIGDPISPYYNYLLEASGGLSLTFNNSGSSASLVQTNNTAASDTISAPLILADNLVVTNRATLTLSGEISGTGKAVTKNGTGTLILSGANTFTGGIAIFGGTLQIGATDTLPVTSTVVLGGTNSAGNLSLPASSQTLAGLTAASTSASATDSITIGAGQTLGIKGTNGLFVGADMGTASTTKSTMTGAGALVVTNPAAAVTVGRSQALDSSNNNGSALDLSGLSSVTLGSGDVPVSEIRVSYGQKCDATLTLSNTNNLITATTLHVGNNRAFNQGSTGNLILGSRTNSLAVDTVNLGLYKGSGTIKFASQAAGSPGSVTIGGKSRSTTDFLIGHKFGIASGAVPTGTLDLRGHHTTVTAGTVTIGKEDNGSGSVFTGGAAGSLLFDTGTFSVTNLIMGVKTGVNTGANAKAWGTLTVGGGEFTVTGGPVTFAFQSGKGSAYATNNILGGLFRCFADILTGPSNCTSVINLDGGTLDMTGHAIGLSGQTVTVFNAKSGTLMNLGEFNAGAPLVKWGAGTLTLAGTNTYAGATLITGGTLTLGEGCQLGGGNYAADITNSGALVSANSANQTLSGTLSGSGTLTQSGNGTLTLGGVNTYAGATAVTAGRLFGVTGGSLSNSDVAVASGATLGVKVLASDAQWSCKSLTLGSGTTTAELRFYGTAPSATTAPLQVNGNFANNGTLNVTLISTSLPLGTYPLIRYTGLAAEGTLGAATLPTGSAGTLTNNAATSTIELVVTTASSPLVWAGSSGDWDINATANWTGIHTSYLEGDLVRFDDTTSGAGPFTVNVAENVNPGSVTVDNPTKDYTFSGPGVLGGDAGLTKRGAGTLTLSGANTYSGGTILESASGTLNATVSAAQNSIGTGPVSIGSGSTLALDNSNTSGATVSQANTFAGTGVLKLNFATNTTARSTALPGLSGFAGTVQLASVSSTGDKWDADNVSAPGATVQIESGNTLVVGTSAASFNTIAVQGAGNSEGRGAIRMGAGAGTLAGAISLQGDTTLASDAASATLTGAITGTAGSGASNILFQGTSASAAGCILSGAISDGPNGGKVALTQTKGTLVLSGPNTYSGATTVNGGSTLQLGATDTLPIAGPVFLGGTNGLGNLNLANFSQKIASLTALSTVATNNVVTIGGGQTLAIRGTTGLFVGTDTGGNSTTQVKMSGGGNLVVTNSSANITVGKAQSDESGANTCSLDLSELSTVVLGSGEVPINEVRITYGAMCPATLTLSNTSNLISAATVNVGNSNHANTPAGNLILGAGANVLAANTLNIALYKGSGTLKFASQTAGSPGTVTIGGRTRATTEISIGNKMQEPTGSNPSGTLDLRGHVANVTAGTVTLGKEDNPQTWNSLQNTNFLSGTLGSLSFAAGDFTVTNLNMAPKSGGSLGAANATLTIGGGVFTVTAGGAFTLASQVGRGSATGTLNIVGGTLRSYANILTGPSNCTSIINLDGGTLDMTGRAIGSSALTVTVFNVRSGTLMNLASFNNGDPLIKTGTNTLSIAGTNTYLSATIVSNGVLRLTSTNCLPPTADLYLTTGTTTQLDYAGRLPIHTLYVDGVRKMGSLYGQNNLSPHLSGTGFLEMVAQGTLLLLQ